MGGAEPAAAGNGVHVFTDEHAWDVLEDIPNDSAASDGLISPLDVIDRPDHPEGGRAAARDEDGRRRGRMMTNSVEG